MAVVTRTVTLSTTPVQLDDPSASPDRTGTWVAWNLPAGAVMYTGGSAADCAASQFVPPSSGATLEPNEHLFARVASGSHSMPVQCGSL